MPGSSTGREYGAGVRAIITGGAGFIGSAVVDELVRTGAAALVVDDLTTGSAGNLRDAAAAGVALVHADVRDLDALRGVFADFRPDVLFHLAAQIDVRISMAEPSRDAAINVVGSANVFTAAAEVGVRRVVNTSTGGAIYGETDVVPTPESVPARPLSAYGLSKRTAEEYGAWFRTARGLDVVTLRYGNVYGPRQNPAGDAGVVARFCDLVLRGGRPTVYGDGKQTRDYVFVEDIARANIAAATARTLRHERYNVGSGSEVSVLALIAAVAEAAGVAPEEFAPEFQQQRTGEVLRSCLDVALARAELGLTEPTPLPAGLQKTLAWHRAR